MRRPAILLAVAFIAGCGGESGDLLAIEVSGVGRSVAIVVKNDGRGTCDGRAQETIPSDLVIEAREVERELMDLAENGERLGTPGPQKRDYVVRQKAGIVRWTEGTGLPEELPRAQLLAVKLDRLLCR